MRDLAQLAESGGLDSIRLFDHLLFRFDGETSGIDISFPDLGPINPYSKTTLSGTAEQIARAFHAYEQAGASHLITHLTPQTPAAIQRLAEAVRQYR